MKKCILGLSIVVVCAAANNSFAQAPASGTSQASAAQSRIVGEVTAVDKATNQVTIKADSGESIIIATSDTSAVLRLPAGETSAQKAVKITPGDIAVGDRIFAKVAGGGNPVVVSQIVVSGGAVSAAASPDPARQRVDRARGLNGRITALNPEKKEISVQSRSRDGVGTITILTSDGTRFFRYAPDSMDVKDASRSSFAGLKVGDQLRALGDTNEDGTRFTADEIISGLTARTGGQVIAVNPGSNEVAIKNNQGQTITVAIGARSKLRRVSTEDVASLEANRPARPDRPAATAGQPPAQDGRPRERRERPAGEERRPRPGRGIQEMIETLPAIKLSDLKKGDQVFVQGTQGADPAHVTAIMLMTGDATFIGRMLQTGPPNRGPQNPGLPGDNLGGGVGSAERVGNTPERP
jgi:preprotein translocase subunit YajC